MATDTKICAKEILKTKSLVERALCISVKSKLQRRPLAFDTPLVVPVGREFDNQSLHGGGEF